jgi:hypothetical protein
MGGILAVDRLQHVDIVEPHDALHTGGRRCRGDHQREIRRGTQLRVHLVAEFQPGRGEQRIGIRGRHDAHGTRPCATIRVGECLPGQGRDGGGGAFGRGVVAGRLGAQQGSALHRDRDRRQHLRTRQVGRLVATLAGIDRIQPVIHCSQCIQCGIDVIRRGLGQERVPQAGGIDLRRGLGKAWARGQRNSEGQGGPAANPHHCFPSMASCSSERRRASRSAASALAGAR